METETITALSTYPLQSAIAVIRISGPQTFETIKKTFVPKNAKNGKNFVSLQRSVGYIKNEKQIIDEVVLSLYKSPKSYTGEDMAEISCHGNPIIINNVLNLLVKNGLRIAEPGEFTKRAFLNGKMDLSQAEATADAISAQNDAALKIALNQLLGNEHKVIESLRTDILNILTKIESEIDFAYEDVHKFTTEQIMKQINDVIKKLDYLIKNSESGVLLKEGVKIAIVGAVNTGKSSLLNLLLNKNKAIVTHIPGTTRDIIEDIIYMDGLPVKISDTAGIRQTDDIIETEGIKRTYAAIESADIILFLIDGSRQIIRDDVEIFNKIKNKRHVVIINKTDLPQVTNETGIKDAMAIKEIKNLLKISCLKNSGINDLTNLIKNIIIKKNVLAVDEIIVANIRHMDALAKARQFINEAVDSCKRDAYELMSFNLRKAADEIGLITGKITSEDVLENIFKNFCIGK
ncbi:MAG: tRNA uridine-5-carboxymethylaminomethyl(34) synthesis GTPase MnmE [Candidatus Goldbacteria bacterium]|nr:tRNA uridine-5-carboxymethylaminomethyl(34) synthesis GTPase MnmE [Candidatus Goldiibacteriota bacterium]